MNAYHSELIEHLTNPPPPGYSAVSVQQVLRADRAAFLLMAEKLPSLKKDAAGENPFEKLLATTLAHSMISFHLLPMLQNSTATKKADKAEGRQRSRSPRKQQPPRTSGPSKEKNKGKGKRYKGRGPNIPKGLIGKALESPGGKRLCWAFNLQGCNDASPGQSCRPMSQRPKSGS